MGACKLGTGALWPEPKWLANAPYAPVLTLDQRHPCRCAWAGAHVPEKTGDSQGFSLIVSGVRARIMGLARGDLIAGCRCGAKWRDANQPFDCSRGSNFADR